MCVYLVIENLEFRGNDHFDQHLLEFSVLTLLWLYPNIDPKYGHRIV